MPMDKRPISKFSLPNSVDHALGQRFNNAKKSLCKTIIELSNAFHRNSITPWEYTEHQSAYLAYFFPLNLLRNLAVIKRLHMHKFLNGIEHIIEVGSGCGTSHIALQETMSATTNYEFVEISEKAIDVHKKLLSELNIENQVKWYKQYTPKKEVLEKESTLLLFSYSLNELPNVPEWIFNAKNLLIIEPSTKADSRNLIKLRSKLIDNHHTVIAPCTHQDDCPLLKESKSDWCHDRIHIKMPTWFKNIEDQLPMTNNTLTFSYLATSKVKKPNPNTARIIGDTQKQKGKTIQMVCMNEKRQFLSWMHKDKNFQFIERGQLIKKPEAVIEKGNELRVQEAIEVI